MAWIPAGTELLDVAQNHWQAMVLDYPARDPGNKPSNACYHASGVGHRFQPTFYG